MKTKLFLLIVSSALTYLALACATPPTVDKQQPGTAAAGSATGTNSATPPSAVPTPTVDYAAIAQKLVTQCAGVKEGEIVQINGEIALDNPINLPQLAIVERFSHCDHPILRNRFIRCP